MDVSLVGGKFNQSMPPFPRYYLSSLFLQLSRRFIMALVDTFCCDHNIFYRKTNKGEVEQSQTGDHFSSEAVFW